MIEPTKENINILVHAVEIFENAFLNSIALATDDYRMSPIFSGQKLSYDDIESIRKRANMTEWDESQCLLDIICEGYEHRYKIDLNEVVHGCIEKSQDSVYNKDDELKLQKIIFDKIKQLKEEKSKHAEE